MRRGGFTLIELMIVIAIIAIIAAIAIPSLLRSQISANERNASASLRQLVNVESMWRNQDADENGVNDYWTGDLSVLYRAIKGGTRKGTLDDVTFARADLNPLAAATNLNTNPTPVTSGNALTAAPKSGYEYQVMTTDETGATYQVNTGGASAGAYFNFNRFAYCAVPDNHGTTGYNTFIVNEDGKVWAIDNGGTVVTTWPGDDPSATSPPWRPIE
jgi:prepilin-type N-terminal cleavage/methylation domain-containing protein